MTSLRRAALETPRINRPDSNTLMATLSPPGIARHIAGLFNRSSTASTAAVALIRTTSMVFLLAFVLSALSVFVYKNKGPVKIQEKRLVASTVLCVWLIYGIRQFRRTPFRKTRSRGNFQALKKTKVNGPVGPRSCQVCF
jgi:hypothetical protein